MNKTVCFTNTLITISTFFIVAVSVTVLIEYGLYAPITVTFTYSTDRALFNYGWLPSQSERHN